MDTLRNIIVKDDAFYKRKKESVDSLLQNSRIAKLLGQYQLDRKFVEDHWIDFLNFEEDLQQCALCQGIEQCPKSFKGYMRELDIVDGEITNTFKVCPYGAKLDEQRRVFSHVSGNMPKEMLLVTFSDLNLDNDGNLILLVKKLIDQATNFSPKGIYVHGEMGNGKTYVMQAFCNLLASNNQDCAFVSVPQLLQDLKSYFKKDEDNGIAHLKEVPYLILDDLGAETVSPWARDEVLYNLLNERMLRKLPTYFTSVYNLHELEQHYTQNKTTDEAIKVKRLIERISALANSFLLVGHKFR